MRFITFILLLQTALLSGQGRDTFVVSNVFRNIPCTLPLYQLYLKSENKSKPVYYDFYLQNDFDQDTSIFLAENYNDHIDCECTAITNHSDIRFLSGRNPHIKVLYEDYNTPATKFILPAKSLYHCKLNVLGIEFFGTNNMHFYSKERYREVREYYRKTDGPSATITYIYITLMAFNFVLLLILYLINKHKVFLYYIIYLMFHLIYGLYLIDLHSWIGQLYPINHNYTSNYTEAIIFIGQAMYVYFVYEWLAIKKLYTKYSTFFFTAIFTFIAYVIIYNIAYAIDDRSPSLNIYVSIIRGISLVFQVILLYIIAFKIKEKTKYFVISGSFFVVLFGVIINVASVKNAFDGSLWEYVSPGNWYMIGGMFEVLCFSLGLGYYYYNLQNENAKLHIEKLEVQNQKLLAEEEKLRDRIRISQDLHDQIGSTLSSIAVYSHVAKKASESDKPMLDQLLNKISDASNEMSTEISDIIWAIHPRNDGIEKISERMFSFAKPLTLAKNAAFQIHIDENIKQLSLDMEQRKNMYLIFKEALINALKYANASKIDVYLNEKNGFLNMTVSDDGIGFTKVSDQVNNLSLNGNGLLNMQNRAKEISGQLTIDSTPGKGTKIDLLFKVQ